MGTISLDSPLAGRHGLQTTGCGAGHDDDSTAARRLEPAGASDRAAASGRRRTPSPVASTTCPPCPIFDIAATCARDVLFRDVDCSSWSLGMRRRTPRAWSSRRAAAKRATGGGTIADSTARTAGMLTRIATTGADGHAPSKYLVQDSCEIVAGTNSDDQLARRSTRTGDVSRRRLPPLGVARHLRYFFGIGREPEALLIRRRRTPFLRLPRATNQR